MATASQNDFAATSAWANLAATITAAASVEVAIQNKSSGLLQVFFGGASAPAQDDDGTYLERYQAVAGSAAKVWVRAPQGATVGVTVL